jgi:hypothetical protein
MMQDARNDGLGGVVNRRGWRKLFGCAGVALAALALGSTAESAPAAERTVVITGTEPEDALFTDGCTSPIGFCARGPFKGNHGFKGITVFTGLAFDAIPDDPLGRQSVPGITTYTTSDGEITIRDASVNDSVRGTFAGVGRIVQGTGEFAGATGDIFTYGQSFPDGTFINNFVINLTLPK